MQQAAGIGVRYASEVRRNHEPDTPQTAQVRVVLGQGAPADGTESGEAKYKRALDANHERRDEEKWPDRSMRQAAGIMLANASRIRYERAPDTPRTTAVRAFLAQDPPTQTEQTGAARFRRANAENNKRPEETRWPTKSMAKAAGIAVAEGFKLRKQRTLGPGVPRKQVDEILAAVPGSFESSRAHYEALLQANEGRQEGTEWIDRDMRKAAGIRASHASEVRRNRAPGTPQTLQVRAFLEEGAPKDGNESAPARYKRALDANDERPDDGKWPNMSMVRAARIPPTNAAKIRYERARDTPRTTAVRVFLERVPPTHEEETSADRFRRADAENARRPENERWPDESMAKGAGASTNNLTAIRKRRAPGTGEPQT